MHKELEKYLSQIEKQLAALPSQQREEELREIRSHLQMMIEENVARGCDADQAVTKALEQFGAASKVGRDLSNETEFRPVYSFRVILYSVLTIVVLQLYDYSAKTIFIPHLPHLSSLFDGFPIIVLFLMIGWSHQFVKAGKHILSRSKVVSSCWSIVSLVVLFLLMTSSFPSYIRIFTFVAFIVGTGALYWQKNHQPSISS